jgi:hypothetical protein
MKIFLKIIQLIKYLFFLFIILLIVLITRLDKIIYYKITNIRLNNLKKIESKDEFIKTIKKYYEKKVEGIGYNFYENFNISIFNYINEKIIIDDNFVYEIVKILPKTYYELFIRYYLEKNYEMIDFYFEIKKQLKKDQEEKIELIKKIAKIRPEILHFYSPKEYIENRELNYIALKDGKSNYLYEKFKNDKELMRILMENTNGRDFNQAGENLRKDKEFINEMLEKYDAGLFEYVHEDLKNDREYILELLKKGYDIYRYINEELRDDKELALIAVKLNNYNYRLMIEKLRNEKELALIAVKKRKFNIQFLPETLKQDKEFMKTVNSIIK